MMTVSELIAELQRQPGHKPVRVLMPEVTYSPPEQDAAEISVHQDDGDAQPVDVVRNAGPFIVVVSRP